MATVTEELRLLSYFNCFKLKYGVERSSLEKGIWLPALGMQRGLQLCVGPEQPSKRGPGTRRVLGNGVSPMGQEYHKENQKQSRGFPGRKWNIL